LNREKFWVGATSFLWAGSSVYIAGLDVLRARMFERAGWLNCQVVSVVFVNLAKQASVWKRIAAGHEVVG
jgi:hypothetical protein